MNLQWLIFMFSCVFVTLLYGVLSQVCHSIVYIPDHCLLLHFYSTKQTYLHSVQGIKTTKEVFTLNIGYMYKSYYPNQIFTLSKGCKGYTPNFSS